MKRLTDATPGLGIRVKSDRPIPAGEVGPSAPEPSVALATVPLEVADLVAPRPPGPAVDDA
jgi:hypothetical protein